MIIMATQTTFQWGRTQKVQSDKGRDCEASSREGSLEHLPRSTENKEYLERQQQS